MDRLIRTCKKLANSYKLTIQIRPKSITMNLLSCNMDCGQLLNMAITLLIDNDIFFQYMGESITNIPIEKVVSNEFRKLVLKRFRRSL